MNQKPVVTRVVVKNNQQMLEIDGKIYPPEFLNPITYPPQALAAWGQAGLKVVTVECNVRDRDGDTYDRPFGPEETKERLKLLFACIPDAWVILRVNLSPSRAWVSSHPGELVRFADGTSGPVYNVLVGPGELEGHYSLCSKAWMHDGGEALLRFLEGLEDSPYFQRIIGTFLGGGGTWEWYYLPPLYKNGSYTGYCEPFRAYYEQFLREKYGTEENLRRAWRREDADFAHPLIPTTEERKIINDAHAKMRHFRTNWNSNKKVIGLVLEENPIEETTCGLFLNAENYSHVADFYRAWHDGVANTINHFARTVKERCPHFICGTFYSNIACTDYYTAGHMGGVFRLFDEGLIDYMVAPGTYNNREPGGHTVSRLIHDSMTVRGVATINENDTRTHRTVDYRRSFNGVYTPEDTVNTMKRDFGRDVCDCVNGYWYDLTWDESWFDDPCIIDLFRRQQQITAASFACSPGKHHEAAVLADIESTHHAARQLSQQVLDYYRSTDLLRAGVPLDFYYHDDVALDNMPDYKLYIVLNGYCLTDGERDAIHRKAAKNNAVVLWLYAPGYINYDREVRMSPDNIARTVGMPVTREIRTLTAHFRADNQHPAMRYASARRFYGCLDRDIHSNVWYDTDMDTVSYVNPVFVIQESGGVQVLGRYCMDGRPAMAYADYKGFRSVYCALPVVRSEILASLAEWAGCHLYSRQDDVLYANDHFVAVHARDDGKRTIRFPKPCSPFEVYEKAYYGTNVTEITVDMELGDTKMWCICDEVSEKLQ